MARFNYGGQALIEGVMMRGRDAIAVAFRHPGGDIVWASEALDSGPHAWRLAKAPFVRGLIVLYETLIVGTRWLIRSANIQASAEGVELGKGSVALMLGLTLVLGVGVFFLLPLLIAAFTTSKVESGWVQHLVEGLIRVGLFLGYLAVISRAPDIRRVFEYHGAEHMTIHALEAGDPLTTDAVRKYPTAHPRCGTEFLVIFIILSILIFSLLVGQSLLVSIIGRILLIPVIASIAYELLRFGAKHRDKVWLRWLYLPGIWLQGITTKQPDDSMIAVAIASMQEALAANHEDAPAGSWDVPRRPMPMGSDKGVSEQESAPDQLIR